MYRGSARVLDAIINGTISYEPPVITVEKVREWNRQHLGLHLQAKWMAVVVAQAIEHDQSFFDSEM